MSTKTCCPVCCSSELTVEVKKGSVRVPFGPLVDVDKQIFTCQICGEVGDFTGQNDHLVDKATAISINHSVEDMLTFLANNGVKMSYLERSLELPVRTVSRWKQGKLSASALALLRCVSTYPWLLEVADEGFKAEASKAHLVRNACASAGDYFKACGINVSASVATASDRETNVTINLSKGFDARGVETTNVGHIFPTYSKVAG